tara:strand:+ start:404 stop:685 length:282 start_codon:yes stop_codon:yes gene_type:complete
MIREFKYLGCRYNDIEEVRTMENDRVTTTVEVADKSGHSTLQLTKEETLERVSDSPGAWVFANNQMVQPQQLRNADWGTVGTVRIVPGLVGGV